MIRIIAGFLLLFFSFSLNAQPRLRINEILASNASILADEKNEFDDWVEIYNDGKDTVDIAEMFLTNDLQKNEKWQFTENKPEWTLISPKGFLLVWCDKDLEQDSLIHSDFKLDADGESLYLLDKNGKTVIDSVRYPRQQLDFSYGRIGEGKEWSYFLTPSPLKSNGLIRKI